MFLNPLGLLALAAVPAVVGLHLFRRRFRPRTVSATFLWTAEDRVPAAGRIRQPLRTNPSFWCEVVAALLLALALAAPRPFGAGEATHLVVVLDRSASMGADAGGAATWGRALDEVRRRIGALPRGSRVTLVGSGRRAEVLAGPAALPVEARERLAAVRPGRAAHSLAPALALAGELVGEGRLVAVTDAFEPDAYPPEVELVAVGASASNVGLVHASRRRVAEPERPDVAERVALTVASFARAPMERTLALRTVDGAPAGRRSVRLDPGERRHVAFDVPDGVPLLVAELEGADALAADDVAYLAPAPRRTLRLASTLPEEIGVHLGLDSSAAPSNIDRWLELVPDSIDTIHPRAAHLVIADSLGALADGGDSWVLALAAPGPERQHLVGPFLTNPAHPLLDGVTLEGIIWSCDPDAELAGAPFISAGALPLATEVERGGRRAWLLDIDVKRSSLHRSPDWPILLANAAEARRAALPGAAATTLALGEPFRFRTSAPATYRWRATAGPALEAGDAPATFEVRDQLLLDDLALPGAYVLEEVQGDAEDAVAAVGVSLADAAESDLRDRSAGDRAAEAREATIRAGFSWVEVLLLALALGLLALDWWVLDRHTGALAAGRGRRAPAAPEVAARA